MYISSLKWSLTREYVISQVPACFLRHWCSLLDTFYRLWRVFTIYGISRSFIEVCHLSYSYSVYIYILFVIHCICCFYALGRNEKEIFIWIVYHLAKQWLYHWISLDVKPSNMLVSSNGMVKICDFGVSIQVENAFTCYLFVIRCIYCFEDDITYRS